MRPAEYPRLQRRRKRALPSGRSVAIAVVVLVLLLAGFLYVTRRPSPTRHGSAAAQAKTSPGAQSNPPSTPPSPAGDASSPRPAADALMARVGCATYRSQVVGDAAAVVFYAVGGCATPGPGGFQGAVYLYQDAGSWHAYTWMGTQNGGIPGQNAGGFYGLKSGHGCIRVHATPSIAGSVTGCIAGGRPIATDGAPVFKENRIWFKVSEANDQLVPGPVLGWALMSYLACSTAGQQYTAHAPDC